MPAFHLLPEEDVEAVVDYVLALTHRVYGPRDADGWARATGRLGVALTGAVRQSALPRRTSPFSSRKVPMLQSTALVAAKISACAQSATVKPPKKPSIIWRACSTQSVITGAAVRSRRRLAA